MTEEVMIQNTLLITTAIATAFAAIAAWCSFEVARRSLDFQKKYAKNQNLVDELNRVIYKAETLKILIPKPLTMSDAEFESIDPLLENLKSELERFDCRCIVDYQKLKISSIDSKEQLSRNVESLNEVIENLEKEKSKIFE